MKRFESKKDVFGGKGTILFEHLLSNNEMNGMCRVYVKLSLPKDSSIGYHVHSGDSEAYYILSGTGKYIAGKDDKMVESVVSAGDVTFTPDGEGHGLENTGEEDLVLIALVINSEQKKI